MYDASELHGLCLVLGKSTLCVIELVYILRKTYLRILEIVAGNYLGSQTYISRQKVLTILWDDFHCDTIEQENALGRLLWTFSARFGWVFFHIQTRHKGDANNQLQQQRLCFCAPQKYSYCNNRKLPWIKGL